MALTPVALSGTTCYCGGLNRAVRLTFCIDSETEQQFFFFFVVICHPNQDVRSLARKI